MGNPVARVDLLEDEQPTYDRLNQLHTLMDGVFSTLSGIEEFTSQLEAEGFRLFSFEETPQTKPHNPPAYDDSRFLKTLWYAAHIAVTKLYRRRITVDSTRSLLVVSHDAMEYSAQLHGQEQADRVKSFLNELNSLHDGRLKVNVQSDTQYRSVLSTMTIVGLLQHYGMLDQTIHPLRYHIRQSQAREHEVLQHVYFHISAAFSRACHDIQDKPHHSTPIEWSFPLVMQRTHEYIVSPSYFEETRENMLMLHSVSTDNDYIVGNGGEFKSLRADSDRLPF